MNIPGNMTTPKLRLEDGEEILLSVSGMRKKGLFGNRYGELHVTNQRVAFVKAIMKAGVISAAANKLGAKPMLAFARAEVTEAAKTNIKKMHVLQLSAGGTSENFWFDEAEVDELVVHLA